MSICLQTRFIRITSTTILACILVIAIFTTDVFQVSSSSMEHTLRDGDYVIVFSPPTTLRQLIPIIFQIHDDSIVVLSLNGRQRSVGLDGENFTERYIKRVVAQDGDRIRINNGILIRNGHPVDEPYVFYKSALQKVADSWPRVYLHTRDVHVPVGDYFVLGDNRAGSLDSRVWGPLDINELQGIVICSFHL